MSPNARVRYRRGHTGGISRSSMPTRIGHIRAWLNASSVVGFHCSPSGPSRGIRSIPFAALTNKHARLKQRFWKVIAVFEFELP